MAQSHFATWAGPKDIEVRTMPWWFWFGFAFVMFVFQLMLKHFIRPNVEFVWMLKIVRAGLILATVLALASGVLRLAGGNLVR